MAKVCVSLRPLHAYSRSRPKLKPPRFKHPKTILDSNIDDPTVQHQRGMSCVYSAIGD